MSNASNRPLLERMEFLGVDEPMRAVLRDALPAIKAALPGLLDKFYGHLQRFPSMIAKFGGPSSVAHARSKQEQHWLNLFSGRFDESYYNSVRTIGLVHAKLGIEPRVYIGGYAFTTSLLQEMLARHYKSRLSPERAQAQLAAVLRAVNTAAMIDMDLAISIYLEENKRSYDERLGKLAADFEQRVQSVVGSVGTAVKELQKNAQSMASLAEKSSAQATAVGSAAIEASTNVQTVASASEELSSSIREIARLVRDSANLSRDAVAGTGETDETIRQLSETVRSISNVAQLISDIASQTNLLALNATIEAARAGDAGKGFAVVASEVKTLAGQTANATEEIQRSIERVQSVADAATKSVVGINDFIRRIDEISSTIASAVEQQGAATQEIARNVAEAATGTTEVTRNIEGVSTAAGETGQTASTVLAAATELSGQASTLQHELGAFLQQLRAA